jgi:BioD-like phosphotransacetylase family protein
MSPVAIERGFTEHFIEKGGSEDEYARQITDAYEHIAADNDLVIIEGTGHAGVGSVFNLSNAVVAKLLGTDVILISSGGVGKPIDEVMLNKALLDKEGVKLAGVVVNKVLPEKYDRISRLVTRGLEQKALSVFGVLPYQKILDIPTMREIKEEIKVNTLYEGAKIDNPVANVLIGAMNVRDALQFITPNSLLIIPGDRDDMMDAVCKVHSGHLLRKACPVSGIILSGGLMPKHGSLRHLERSKIPVLITKEDTYSIASRVHSMIVKLKPQDTAKIKIIVDMVDKCVDIDKVLASLR